MMADGCSRWERARSDARGRGRVEPTRDPRSEQRKQQLEIRWKYGRGTSVRFRGRSVYIEGVSFS